MPSPHPPGKSSTWTTEAPGGAASPQTGGPDLATSRWRRPAFTWPRQVLEGQPGRHGDRGVLGHLPRLQRRHPPPHDSGLALRGLLPFKCKPARALALGAPSTTPVPPEPTPPPSGKGDRMGRTPKTHTRPRGCLPVILLQTKIERGTFFLFKKKCGGHTERWKERGNDTYNPASQEPTFRIIF